MKKHQKNSGFTLLEVVASIVLIAIVSMIAAAAVVYVARGFVLVSTGTEIARNVHIATSRIIKELESLDSISSASGNALSYTIDVSGYTLSYDGATLFLDSNPSNGPVPLLKGFFDNSSFQFRYLDSFDDTTTSTTATEMVEIWMKMDLGNGSSVEFTTRVFLRNL